MILIYLAFGLLILALLFELFSIPLLVEKEFEAADTIIEWCFYLDLTSSSLIFISGVLRMVIK